MNLLLVAPVTESGKYAVAYGIATMFVYGGLIFIAYIALRFITSPFRRK